MSPSIVTAKNRRIKCMPFGPPNTSKTTWACGAQDHPDMRPVLVADSDDGLLSVAARGDIAAEECSTIAQYEALLTKIAGGDPVYRDFKTLITDSGSDLLDKALREEAASGFLRAQEGEGRGRKLASRTSQDELYQRDYGIVTTRMKRLFDRARSLPMHIIITSLSATHYPVIGKDKNGEDILSPDPDSVHPLFTARLGVNLRGLMDFVWYFYRDVNPDTKETTFKFLTQEHGPYKAKTRGSKFPEAIGAVSSLSLPEVYDLLIQTEGA